MAGTCGFPHEKSTTALTISAVEWGQLEHGLNWVSKTRAKAEAKDGNISRVGVQTAGAALSPPGCTVSGEVGDFFVNVALSFI
jgi:hypothetical protein